MPAKDVTPTDGEREKLFDAAATLAEDIHKRWPVWNELAKNELGKFSSAYMLIASHLLASGMMAMLYAQVPETSVAKTVEDLFDLYTDPDMLAQLAELRHDKKEILAFSNRLLRDQSDKLAKRKAAN